MSNEYLNKVVIFDINGPMAHFRKYYTNTSALSYLWPPKPVIAGLIAGILGLPNEKEESNKERIYYEKFNNNDCFMTVSPRTKIRKIMQKVNYSFTKTSSKQIVFTQATQVPLEILIPVNNDEISYRIYFYHKKEGIYLSLKKQLKENSVVYPPYLGLSEFLASVKYIGEGKVESIEKNNEEIKLYSICKLNDISPTMDKNSGYIVEKMPTGFSNNRVPTSPDTYLFSLYNPYIKVKLKEGKIAYSVIYSENGKNKVENIIFM